MNTFLTLHIRFSERNDSKEYTPEPIFVTFVVLEKVENGYVY